MLQRQKRHDVQMKGRCPSPLHYQLIESVFNRTWLKVPFGLVIGTVFATGLDLFMPCRRRIGQQQNSDKKRGGKSIPPRPIWTSPAAQLARCYPRQW